MARLPTPGGDNGNWGNVLNDYLLQSHKTDGMLKDNIITASNLAAGTITKATVGLDNVNNTPDADKPISTATQTALNTKLAISDIDAQIATRINDVSSATAGALTVSYASKKTKDIAGSNNTALSIRDVTPRLLDLVNATQSITITVPIGASFTLSNSTNYAQSVKRAGSTKSVMIAPGASMEIQS